MAKAKDRGTEVECGAGSKVAEDKDGVNGGLVQRLKWKYVSGTENDCTDYTGGERGNWK